MKMSLKMRILQSLVALLIILAGNMKISFQISLDRQPEIQILNLQDLEQTDADSVYLMKTHLNSE